MIWFMVLQVVSTLVELVRLGKQSESKKVLEILLLRRQLAIYELRQKRSPRLSRSEKLTLVVLGSKLKASTGRTINAMGKVIRIVKPATLFSWHQQLVRLKWTYQHRLRGGRPRTDHDIERLVVRLARENDWGIARIEGELLKLGYTFSHQTVAIILKRRGIPPAPQRSTSPGWRHLLTHYKDQLVACDFFTVETLFLQTIYVLVFIEIGSRRVHFANCPTYPNGAWVTQQARQIMWQWTDRQPNIRFLIRDNDAKFTLAFDGVFRSQAIDVIPTPLRAPNANAFMEQWIRSVREECLNQLLIINETHLRQVMCEYTEFFNTARSHQGLHQHISIPNTPSENQGMVHCRNILGGIIHDYHRDAA